MVPPRLTIAHDHLISIWFYDSDQSRSWRRRRRRGGAVSQQRLAPALTSPPALGTLPDYPWHPDRRTDSEVRHADDRHRLLSVTSTLQACLLKISLCDGNPLKTAAPLHIFRFLTLSALSTAQFNWPISWLWSAWTALIDLGLYWLWDGLNRNQMQLVFACVCTHDIEREREREREKPGHAFLRQNIFPWA